MLSMDKCLDLFCIFDPAMSHYILSSFYLFVCPSKVCKCNRVGLEGGGVGDIADHSARWSFVGRSYVIEGWLQKGL